MAASPGPGAPGPTHRAARARARAQSEKSEKNAPRHWRRRWNGPRPHSPPVIWPTPISTCSRSTSSSTAARRTRHCSSRIDAVQAEYTRLKGWQHWGGGLARDELVLQAEALAAATLGEPGADIVKLSIRQQAEVIDDLRARWKELDRLGWRHQPPALAAFRHCPQDRVPPGGRTPRCAARSACAEPAEARATGGRIERGRAARAEGRRRDARLEVAGRCAGTVSDRVATSSGPSSTPCRTRSATSWSSAWAPL